MGNYLKIQVMMNLNAMTIQALENISHAILVVERQAVDHLPGGVHYRPSENQQAEASNVPSHNKASESDFTILDLLIRMKPNANIETIEMITMWYRNKLQTDFIKSQAKKKKISRGKQK